MDDILGSRANGCAYCTAEVQEQGAHSASPTKFKKGTHGVSQINRREVI